MIFGRKQTELPTRDDALPGRTTRPFSVGDKHLVLGTPIEGHVPAKFPAVVAVFGIGEPDIEAHYAKIIHHEVWIPSVNRVIYSPRRRVKNGLE